MTQGQGLDHKEWRSSRPRAAFLTSHLLKININLYHSFLFLSTPTTKTSLFFNSHSMQFPPTLFHFFLFYIHSLPMRAKTKQKKKTLSLSNLLKKWASIDWATHKTNIQPIYIYICLTRNIYLYMYVASTFSNKLSWCLNFQSHLVTYISVKNLRSFLVPLTQKIRSTYL